MLKFLLLTKIVIFSIIHCITIQQSKCCQMLRFFKQHAAISFKYFFQSLFFQRQIYLLCIISKSFRGGEISMKHYISKVWIENDRVFAQTGDGLVASYPLAIWKRLSNATQEQLNDFYLSYSGIHWPQLDEDLSFEGMFHSCGLCELTETEDSVCYMA